MLNAPHPHGNVDAGEQVSDASGPRRGVGGVQPVIRAAFLPGLSL